MEGIIMVQKDGWNYEFNKKYEITEEDRRRSLEFQGQPSLKEITQKFLELAGKNPKFLLWLMHNTIVINTVFVSKDRPVEELIHCKNSIPGVSNGVNNIAELIPDLSLPHDFKKTRSEFEKLIFENIPADIKKEFLVEIDKIKSNYSDAQKFFNKSDKAFDFDAIIKYNEFMLNKVDINDLDNFDHHDLISLLHLLQQRNPDIYESIVNPNIYLGKIQSEQKESLDVFLKLLKIEVNILDVSLSNAVNRKKHELVTKNLDTPPEMSQSYFNKAIQELQKSGFLPETGYSTEKVLSEFVKKDPDGLLSAWLLLSTIDLDESQKDMLIEKVIETKLENGKEFLMVYLDIPEEKIRSIEESLEKEILGPNGFLER